MYDLFDLGEFDRERPVRTKYGTRDEYLAAIKATQNEGIHVYADIVFNHKLGADEPEEFRATPYNPEDRRVGFELGEPGLMALQLLVLTAWGSWGLPILLG